MATFDFAAVQTQRQALKQQKEQASTKAFMESLESDHENTKKSVAEIREATAELAKRGGTDEQIDKGRDASFALLKSFADRLDQMSAFADQAGQGSEFPIGSGDEFIDSQMQLFESTIESAKLSTPSATGAQDAESKLAEAQRLAEALDVPVERVAKAMNILPADKTPVAGVGPSGETGFFREGPEGFEQIPGAAPIPSGMEIDIAADGAIRVTTGTKTNLQRPTLARLEKSILDSQEGMARLIQIRDSFDPKFLTFGGKFENFKLATLDKIDPDSLSNEDKQFLTGYSTFTQSAINNLNLHIKELTGAQMSEFEADRLRKGIPDPENDGPTVFKAKMDANTRQLALVRARAMHVKNQGFDKDPWEVFDLNQIEDIIASRADQLTVHFTRQGIDGDEARQAALDQIAQEFGLP